jgi:hypothetical protein
LQTRLQSLVEVCLSIAVGFCLSLLLQVFLVWRDGVNLTLGQSLEWTGYFTILAIVRGYFLRRFFNWFHNKQK